MASRWVGGPSASHLEGAADDIEVHSQTAPFCEGVPTGTPGNSMPGRTGWGVEAFRGALQCRQHSTDVLSANGRPFIVSRMMSMFSTNSPTLCLCCLSAHPSGPASPPEGSALWSHRPAGTYPASPRSRTGAGRSSVQVAGRRLRGGTQMPPGASTVSAQWAPGGFAYSLVVTRS